MSKRVLSEEQFIKKYKIKDAYAKAKLVNVLMIQFIKKKNNVKSEELELLAQCLAQQTMAAESLSNLPYQKVNKKEQSKKTVKSEEKNGSNELHVIESNVVQERMKMLDNIPKDNFNGDINSVL